MDRKKKLHQCLLGIVLALTIVSCESGGQNKQQHLLELSTQVIHPVNRVINENFSAIIRGKQDIDIRPQISGFITQVKVDEGVLVKKGQVLFTIDPVQYQEAVNVAKANIEVAKANVKTATLTEKNKKDLTEKKVISEYDYLLSKNQLESSKALLMQANAQLVAAEKNLSYTSVTSPTDGIVGRIPFRVGALVSPSMVQSLTTVSEYSQMYAYFSMTEKDLLELSQQKPDNIDVIGMLPEVTLQLANGSTYNEHGTIKTISGVIDETTGAVSVRALFPNNNRLLRSGGTGVIVMPHSLENCYVVPQSATYEVQDKKFIYTLDASSIAHATIIETYPIDNGQEYIVTQGLKKGDVIITEGVSGLRDGMTIHPKSL